MGARRAVACGLHTVAARDQPATPSSPLPRFYLGFLIGLLLYRRKKLFVVERGDTDRREKGKYASIEREELYANYGVFCLFIIPVALIYKPPRARCLLSHYSIGVLTANMRLKRKSRYLTHAIPPETIFVIYFSTRTV